MISSTLRFSDRVEQYVRGRPSYPQALLDFLRSVYFVHPSHMIADIGSGTGLLTELFVRNGYHTFAVEPNGPMRAAAETSLGHWPNFQSIIGTAEATTLAPESVDLVTAAQAFHWFDSQRTIFEFKRILRPNGLIALIWNERINAGSAFMSQFEKLLQRYRKPGEADRRDLTSKEDPRNVERLFAAAGLRFDLENFANPQLLDRQSLIDRAISSSYIPIAGEAGFSSLVTDLHLLFDAHQVKNRVTVEHETRLYVLRLS